MGEPRQERPRNGNDNADDGGIEVERPGYTWALKVATDMGAAIFIGLAMGYYLDRWLETSPWLLLVFFLFGSAAGFLNLYRTLNPGHKYPDAMAGKEDEKAEKDKTPPNSPSQ